MSLADTAKQLEKTLATAIEMASQGLAKLSPIVAMDMAEKSARTLVAIEKVEEMRRNAAEFRANNGENRNAPLLPFDPEIRAAREPGRTPDA